MAIVLIILSLLSGGLMMTLGTQVDLRNSRDTQQQLQDIRDALLGYAASHPSADGKPHFPCPDTDGDGQENRTGNTCANSDGHLPWNDLGLGLQDAWGNRFRYHVEPSFARNDMGFTLNKVATLRICEQAACTSTLATQIPAIIISHGKNGLGATSVSNLANPLPVSADETENTDGDADFVSHESSPAGPNEFDDLVIWISPNVLYNRLIAAGRLP